MGFDEDGEIIETTLTSVIEVTYQGLPVSPTKCPGPRINVLEQS